MGKSMNEQIIAGAIREREEAPIAGVPDWLSLKEINELRDRFDRDVAAVKADEDLNPAARARKVRELAEDFQASYTQKKRELEGAIEGHRRALTRKAYPAEQMGEDVQRELLEEIRAGRIEREIAAQYEGGGFNPIEALEDARYRGDATRQAVIERIGKRYLPNDERMKTSFAQLVQEGREERMTSSQRAALEGLEAFESQSRNVGQALALSDYTTRSKLNGLSKMSSPEDRRGLANLAQGLGAGGQVQQRSG